MSQINFYRKSRPNKKQLRSHQQEDFNFAIRNKDKSKTEANDWGVFCKGFSFLWTDIHLKWEQKTNRSSKKSIVLHAWRIRNGIQNLLVKRILVSDQKTEIPLRKISLIFFCWLQWIWMKPQFITFQFCLNWTSFLFLYQFKAC